MTTGPLVSVICLCYNHQRFVTEAIQSVLDQTYDNIQLIVVDDASTDGSAAIIRDLAVKHPFIETLLLKENQGNCRAFNRGLALARGEFVIDLATDDVLMPERIAQQVDFFSSLDDSYGVVFTDATYIDENGRFLRDHYAYLFSKGLLNTVPQGDLYSRIIARYFVCSPTMMIRKKVLDELHGYDEALSYEDFDFWIRSARNYKYAFLDRKLTRVRRSARSMSTGWYRKGDRQLYSTYLICKKIATLNRSDEEHQALAVRLKYELRQSVFSENFYEADLFYELLKTTGTASAVDNVLYGLNRLKLPFSMLRRWYHKLRFGA
jgi:glycosyltransferase involved in cell wall biosynthesis